MPRFYLHLYNGSGPVCDAEGADLATLEEARDLAFDSIRDVISEEARGGRIDLRGRVDIANEANEVLATILFQEAFDLHLEDQPG